MITAELRRAILAAAGHDHDPLLRPGPQPGSYTSSLPFRLPPETRQALAARLRTEPWIATVEIDGYLTVTVTHDALAGLAVRIARGANVGADAYLTKPFDPGEMIRVVRELAGAPPA